MLNRFRLRKVPLHLQQVPTSYKILGTCYLNIIYVPEHGKGQLREETHIGMRNLRRVGHLPICKPTPPHIHKTFYISQNKIILPTMNSTVFIVFIVFIVLSVYAVRPQGVWVQQVPIVRSLTKLRNGPINPEFRTSGGFSPEISDFRRFHSGISDFLQVSVRKLWVSGIFIPEFLSLSY